MILASKNYINFQAKDLEEWKVAINEDYKYCKFLVYWEDFPCDPIDLPSWHPYWENEVKKKDLIKLNRLIPILEECRLNSKLIKYNFNASTSLEDVEKEVKELRERCKNIK